LAYDSGWLALHDAFSTGLQRDTSCEHSPFFNCRPTDDGRAIQGYRFFLCFIGNIRMFHMQRFSLKSGQFPVLRCSLFLACILLARLAACTDEPPAPPVTPGPDTTSHNWEFTLYEVGGMNTVLTDVAALSPDCAIAVGKVQMPGTFPEINAFVWNGTNLTPINLPMYPHDTVTIDPHHNNTTWAGWPRLNAIWAFRRDNIWYSSETGAIAHMTIRGKDTCVKQETYLSVGEQIGFASMRIWAKDTSELYFGGYQGRVARYKNGVWTAMPLTIQGQLGDARDIFGTSSENILLSIVGNLNYKSACFRYDGTSWKVLYDYGPSLSPTVEFGLPLCFWVDPSEDSLWIAGLWLGRMQKESFGPVRAVEELNPYGVIKIHGSKWNNVFFCGYRGTIIHWNGHDLRRYENYLDQSITLHSVFALENDVFIVGTRYFGGGVFIHGRRVN
jgi:hypothetical protein